MALWPTTLTITMPFCRVTFMATALDDAVMDLSCADACEAIAATPAAATPMSAGPGRISAARPWPRGLLRGFDRQHVRIDPEHAFGHRKGVEEPRAQVRPALPHAQSGSRLLSPGAEEVPTGS